MQKERKNVVIKQNCHSRKFLSGIYNACRCKIKENTLLNRCVEDPRYQPSGMTPNFTPARGFTLIELLVVVLIIGILAAIAVPQYQKAVAKVRAVELMSVINAGQKALSTYMLTGKEYTVFFSDNTLDTIDKLNELDIEIPLTNALKKQYNWYIYAGPSEWGISAAGRTGTVDLDIGADPIMDGECVGWDTTGVVMCRMIAQQYNFVCRDGSGSYLGAPPLCQ